MYEVVSIIIIVFGILQIILFFKVWGMTNDVKNVLNVLNSRDYREVKLPNKAKLKESGTEVDVLGIKNGKVHCRINYGSSWSEELIGFDKLAFKE